MTIALTYELILQFIIACGLIGLFSGVWIALTKRT